MQYMLLARTRAREGKTVYLRVYCDGKDEAEQVPAYKHSTKGGKRPGNPRYLAGVRSCIETRCRLLGLEAQ